MKCKGRMKKGSDGHLQATMKKHMDSGKPPSEFVLDQTPRDAAAEPRMGSAARQPGKCTGLFSILGCSSARVPHSMVFPVHGLCSLRFSRIRNALRAEVRAHHSAQSGGDGPFWDPPPEAARRILTDLCRS